MSAIDVSGGFDTKNVATLGVEFAQSLAMALVAASLMLVVGSLLVRVFRAWEASVRSARRVRVSLEPAPVGVHAIAPVVRPSAGVSASAPTRAPPTTSFSTVRHRQALPPKLRLSE